MPGSATEDQVTSREDYVARARELVDREPGEGAAGNDNELTVWLRRLCRAAAKALPASGAGVSLMSGEGAHGVVAASDAASLEIEDLQFTLGEGPCVDAFSARRPVLTPDLAGQGNRWPGYASAAHEHGVHAVFAFPLQIGAAGLGVLDIYRDTAGSLEAETLSLCLAFADAALLFVLDLQETSNAGGTMPGPGDSLGNRAEIYQAQGMLRVQLGIGLAEAMARLRAYAYAQNRPIAEVARDIVMRRVTLEGDDR